MNSPVLVVVVVCMHGFVIFIKCSNSVSNKNALRLFLVSLAL